MSNAWGKVSSDESDKETVKKIEDLYFDGKSGKQVCVSNEKYLTGKPKFHFMQFSVSEDFSAATEFFSDTSFGFPVSNAVASILKSR